MDGVRIKFEIARNICESIPSLEERLFVERGLGKIEPYSSALFSAVSMILTYYHLECLFD
jgi:hypothetical protein